MVVGCGPRLKPTVAPPRRRGPPVRIAGAGLFARAPIPAGTAVSRLGGRLVTDEELRELFARPQRGYVDTITVADDLHLVLPPVVPTARATTVAGPEPVWGAPFALVTRRDVAAGEELTNDYATSTGSAEFAMACGCGSAYCRRSVTSHVGGWRTFSTGTGTTGSPLFRARIQGRTPTAHSGQRERLTSRRLSGARHRGWSNSSPSRR